MINLSKGIVAALLFCSIAACEFNNPVDPGGSDYQGYNTVKSLNDISPSPVASAYFLPVLKASFCEDAVTYRFQVSRNVDLYGIDEFEAASATNWLSVPDSWGLTAGTYSWRVRGESGSTVGEWSAVSEFTLLGVQNLSPTGACDRDSFDGNFTWDGISGISQYDIQIASTADISGAVGITREDQNQHLDASWGSNQNMAHAWRVRPVDDEGNPGVWSSPGVFSFQPVENPELLDGVDSATTDIEVPGWTVNNAGVVDLNEGANLGYADVVNGFQGAVFFGSNPNDPISISQTVAIPPDAQSLNLSLSWTWYGISALYQRNAVIEITISGTSGTESSTVSPLGCVEYIASIPLASFAGETATIEIRRPVITGGWINAHLGRVWIDYEEINLSEHISDIRPLNSETWTSNSPEFSWIGVSGANYYELYYSADSPQTIRASMPSIVYGTEYSGITVPYGDGVFWQVRPVYSGGTPGPWGPVLFTQCFESVFSEEVLGMDFAEVLPAGETADFLLGSSDDETSDEYPSHTAALTKPFALGAAEVTRKQFEELMYYAPVPGLPSDDHPVTVNWYAAANFCNALSIREGRTPVYDFSDYSLVPGADGYRLPTEAEWEFAAGGGTLQPGYDFSGGDVLTSVGWYSDNSSAMLHPVAMKASNAVGLYDMSGNLWEWCQDYYAADFYSAAAVSDPCNLTGTQRVLRGGSYADPESEARIVNRFYDYPDNFLDRNYGFRILRPLD